MRRFYFHVRDGNKLYKDEEGWDLPDVATAKREALRSARELLAEAVRSGKDQVPDAFLIADEAGRAVDTIPIPAVLPRRLKR